MAWMPFSKETQEILECAGAAHNVGVETNSTHLLIELMKYYRSIGAHQELRNDFRSVIEKTYDIAKLNDHKQITPDDLMEAIITNMDTQAANILFRNIINKIVYFRKRKKHDTKKDGG